MKPQINLTGNSYGNLTVRCYSHTVKLPHASKRMWICDCVCGNTTLVSTGDLRRRNPRLSCKKCKSVKHGHTKNNYRSGEYYSWSSMKERCYCPRNIGYHDYGGRGIKVCDRWLESFENFLEDMGLRPSQEYSLERIDNNGNYESDNCIWSTHKKQCINKRNNVWVTIEDRTMILKDWLAYLNMSYATYFARIRRGMTTTEALTAPRKKRQRLSR